MKKFIIPVILFLAACQSATNTPAKLPSISPATPVPSKTPSPATPIAGTPTPLPTVPASVVELEGARVQPGFSLIKFADLYHPTAITFDPSGRMYAASQDGNVYLLTDKDQDGRADSRSNFAVGYNFPLGIAVHPTSGEVYVSYQGAIIVVTDTDDDGRADEQRFLVEDLPFGKHQNDNLEFGPDGWLYIGVGSTCDACEDPDPRSASILRFNGETGESELFATGLRNPFDIAFHPETGALFATDNGLLPFFLTGLSPSSNWSPLALILGELWPGTSFFPGFVQVMTGMPLASSTTLISVLPIPDKVPSAISEPRLKVTDDSLIDGPARTDVVNRTAAKIA